MLAFFSLQDRTHNKMNDQPPDPTANYVRDEVQVAFNVFDVEKKGTLPAKPEVLLPFMKSLGFDSMTPSEIQVCT